MRTFRDVADEIARVAGQAGLRVQDARVRTYLNLAQERLAAEGLWVGSTQIVRFCVKGRCFALPHQYESVRYVAVDETPVPVMSGWYSLVSEGIKPDGQYAAFEDAGEHPVVYGTSKARRLKVYSLGPELDDSGSPKTVRIFGLDENGREVVSPDDGLPGLTFELRGHETEFANKFHVRSQLFTKVLRVQKPVTRYDVEVFYDDDSGDSYFAARYLPRDVNPVFRHYRVLPLRDDEYATVRAMVVKRFLPVIADDDPLFIDNLPALRNAVRAIAYEDAGRLDLASSFWGMARGALRAEKNRWQGPKRPSIHVSFPASFGDIPSEV